VTVEPLQLEPEKLSVGEGRALITVLFDAGVDDGQPLVE
jgi:hypothetical protein